MPPADPDGQAVAVVIVEGSIEIITIYELKDFVGINYFQFADFDSGLRRLGRGLFVFG
jgi:hypothetical protein